MPLRATVNPSASAQDQQLWIRSGWRAWVTVVSVLWFAVVVGLVSGTVLYELGPGELLSPAPDPVDEPVSAVFTVQVGAFRNYANAERLAAALEAEYGYVQVVETPTGLYLVSLGPYVDEELAKRIAQEIEADMDLSPLLRQSEPANAPE